MAVAIRAPHFFVQKEEVPILSSRRVGSCTHRGTSRKAIRISIFRGVDGKRERLCWLPSLRSCCLPDVEVRRRWWTATFVKLDAIFGAKPDRRAREDRTRLELRLRRWVALPVGLRPLQRDVRAAEKLAREGEVALDAAIATRLNHVAPCWAAIDCLPGSNPAKIKEAFQRKLNLLNRNGASVDEFKQADYAMRECIERLRTGIW
jgi:hypothetical protein